MSEPLLRTLFPIIYQESENHPDWLPESLQPYYSEKQTKIPKILHFIWLGKKVIPQPFLDNMAFFAAEMARLGGESFLWFDDMNTVYRNPWFHENGVKPVPVGSLFSNEQNMPGFFDFRAALYTVPPNYGIASDMLRYQIIEKVGGYYLDCDIEKDFVDLEKLVEVGEKSPYQLVCGYYKYPRTDIFGSSSHSSFSKHLNSLIINNFKDANLKDHIGYFRPYLNYTVLFTGPDPFVYTMEALFLNPKEFGFERGDSPEKMESEIMVPVNIPSTAVSWRYSAPEMQKVIFENDQERRIRLQHDLMKSLIFEGRILDLEKYAPYLKNGEELFLIKTIEALVKTDPKIFAKVDRIFVSSVDHYRHLKTLLEKELNIKSWNELAVLKFAAVMQAKTLVEFLLKEQKVNPFSHEVTEMGHYDCSKASPFSIAIERGNIKLVNLMLETASSPEVVKEALNVPEINLIYAGPRYFNEFKVHRIVDLKLETLYEKLKDLPKDSHGFAKYDFDRQNYLALKRLLQPYLSEE